MTLWLLQCFFWHTVEQYFTLKHPVHHLRFVSPIPLDSLILQLLHDWLVFGLVRWFSSSARLVSEYCAVLDLHFTNSEVSLPCFETESKSSIWCLEWLGSLCEQWVNLDLQFDDSVAVWSDMKSKLVGYSLELHGPLQVHCVILGLHSTDLGLSFLG